jgi:predicted transposase/invertase (TIGR01784 family)
MTPGNDKPSLNHPYDSFFKSIMKKRKLYLPFLRQYLPRHILPLIDLRTVRPTNAHFVDENLRSSYSDCLFQARQKKSGKPALIYVLIEHQSTVDKFIAFRIWHYIHSAWKQYLDDHPKAETLPLIVPMLFYQGVEKHTAKLNIRDLVQAPPDVVDKVFSEPIHLLDLRRISDKRLRTRVELSGVLLTMKHIKDENPPLRAVFRELMRIQDSWLRIQLISLVVLLFLNAGHDITIEMITEQTKNLLGPPEKEAVMTGAERLRREGHREGRMEERIHTAEKLLKLGSDVEWVAEFTGFPAEKVRKIKGRGRNSNHSH